MNKIIGLLVIFFICLSSSFAQDLSKEDKLYLRTVFQLNEGSEDVINIVRNEINKDLSGLGNIVVSEEGYKYIIRVTIDLRKSAVDVWYSRLNLQASVTEPGSEESLFSASIGGAIYELSGLCRDLVLKIDSGFLRDKYKKPSSEVMEFGAQKELTVSKETIDLLLQKMSAMGIIEGGASEPQKQIVQANPDRAAKIAEISYYAKSTAKQAHEINPVVPEDAYRHVLWSYLLTKEFGSKIAKEITDSYEAFEFTDSDADHRMDFNNNEIGRRYYLEGVTQENIPERVINDPAVIRQPYK
jgi:hypothetical protein